MNLETNTKIETIYDFLDESGYPYLSNDEEYKEKQFEVDYNGLKLIVTRSNNMDADDEQLMPNTFSYFIKVGGRVINNSAKDVPKILDYLKSRYADGGSLTPKLLAPNGKPSNLTPEQYRLVRTPAFKEWFGDWENSPETASKVVDENGEPLVVYHGTNTEILVFKPKKFLAIETKEKNGFVYERTKKRIPHKAFYFTDRYDIANDYAKDRIKSRKKGDINVIEVFLKISNPFRVDYFIDREKIDKIISQQNNYDGVLGKERFYGNKYNSFVTYHSNQIKLADGSNTTFDGSNPDIRYAEGGGVNLPKALYHLTSLDKYTLIKEKGLLKDYSVQSKKKKGIYLTDDISVAKNYSGFYDFGTELVLLKIDLTGLDENKFGSDDSELQDFLDDGGWGNKEDKRIKDYYYWDEVPPYLSLKWVNQIQYHEDIPKENIHLVEKFKIKYKNGGSLTMKAPKLLAPNGQPSNLTPEQYRLVRTPAFKAWFGDWENDSDNASKVVDDNGEPLVVFRGMAEQSSKKYVFNYNYYQIKESGRRNKFGFYFTDNYDVARAYAVDSSRSKIIEKIKNIYNVYENSNDFEADVSKRAIVKEYFIKSNNYLDLRSYDSLSYIDLLKILNVSDKGISEFIEKYFWKKSGRFIQKHEEKFAYSKRVVYDLFITQIEKGVDIEDLIGVYFKNKITEKYNGVIFTENTYEKSNTYVSFEPTQIKLADGTNTTFDSNNPDIRYANGGKVYKDKVGDYINSLENLLSNPRLEKGVQKNYKEELNHLKLGVRMGIYKLDDVYDPTKLADGGGVEYSEDDKLKASKREYNLDKENNKQRDSIKVLWDYLEGIIKKYERSKTDNELEGIKYNLSPDDENSEIVVQVPKGEGIISGEITIYKNNKLVSEFLNDEDYPQEYYEYYMWFTDKNGKKYRWRHRTKAVSRFIKKLKAKYTGKFSDGGTLTMMKAPTLLAPNGKPTNLTPEQYQLADGSNTTFDGSNPDIRFDDGGLIEKEIKISDILEENRDGQKLSDAIINVKDGLGSQTGGNILVREVNGKYEVGDGFHRLAKAVIDGRKTIKADIISNHIRYADGGLIEQSTTLYFREGNSDKEYHIQLVDLGRGDYVVNFQYGRRGGSLKSGTKTENPVTLYQAEDIFASLKSEKMRKGYEPNNQQQHIRPTETKKVDVIEEEISVKKALEYLNYLFLITEPEAEQPEAEQIRILPQLLNAIENEQPYIDDDSFLAQEKKDGERRMIISDSFGIKGLNKKGQEVPVLDEIKDSIDSICVLDGEIIGTRLYVFDILSLNNRELKSLACVDRIQILESINFGNSVIVVQTAYTKTDKQKLFDKLKDERREGIVFKKKLAPYTVGRPSSGGNQLKFKFYKTATFIVANSTPNKRSVGLELIDNNTQRVFMGKVTIPPNYEVPEIGDLVEVRYLYAYRGGAVYQPVYLGKRNDSDLTDATMRQIVFKADEYADGGITKKKETDKKDLVALHNISPYQIIEADKLGGMVTPSIAILKAGERYTDFGEITLIADKDLINPENSSVRVFSGDVYSPSVPNKLYVISPELEKKGRELSVKAYSSKYRDFGGAISNLIQDYGSVYKDMRRLPKDELIAKYYEDLRLVYLIDKGIDFEIPYEDKEQYLWGNQQFTLTKEQKERAKELLKKHSEETVGSSRDISKETIKGFYDLYWEVVFDINFEEFKDEEVDIRELSEKMTKDRYKALFEKYIGDESWISNFYIDKLSDIVSAKQVINKSELANSIKSEFTPEVEADYKKWVDDFMNRYQGSEYFEKGNKKIPYNLENLVEATTGSVRGVEKNLTYSQNKAKSFSSKEFKSIEDIKKSKDKLVSKEQMNLIDEQNKEAFLELYDRLNYEWESSWKGLDSLAMAVADFYKGKSASQALQKNDFKNPTNHQITIFEDFAKKLKNSPVDYFEAKIQRAVLLSEFNYAVVPSEGLYPKGVIDEVVKILEKNDLQVYYYNPNVVKDRMKVVNSIVRKDKSLKFDMGGQAPDVIINPTQIECHNCHWEWKVKDGGDDLFICHKCNYDNTKFYKFEGLEGQKIIQSISYAKGGRTTAQTPAPKKDQIKGSDKNKEGSSKDLKSAKKIELSDKTIEAIKNKVNKHNEEYPKKKITIDSAKAVVRRGMGAYSSSYRPTISGGKPNSRVAWGLARLNAFIYKIIKGTSKSGKYSQDNDLIEELGYKVAKYEIGGIFHGSHYYFDKFSTNKIGSGIGQQKDGWGIYLTDDKESSKSYGNYIYETTLFKDKNLDEYNFLDINKPVKKDLVEKIIEPFQKLGFNVSEILEFDYMGFLFYKTLSRKLGGDKKASLFLLNNGIDGIKRSFENSEGVIYRTDYVIFDENAITIENKEHLQNNYYADGGLAIDQYTSEKIKKAFVSIRIRYESGRAEDDTKDFYFNKYELKSFDQKPFEELKDHKLKGILGVSTSNYNLSEWLVHRECLVVMPFDKFKEMNDTEQVQYYDADYLSKNGFDSLHRLYDRKGRTDEDYRSVLQNVFPKIAMEFNLEAMVTQYSNLYAVEYWFNVYNSSRFIDYVSKQKRIDSPEELAQIVVDYSKSEQSVTDYYYQKPAKELTVESIIKPIINGIVSSGRIYVDESEWLIKNKELVIPENSQLFFVIKDYENMRDKYEEIISQYDLRSSYKIGFINQKNLNDLQTARFHLKDLKWKSEYEKARTNTEKKILKALKNIQSNIIEDWTNKIIDDFKETYSDSVYSDYDGNEYSTNILEVPSAIIYFDSLMLKFIEIYDSYIDNILKTKHRYSFSYIFNDFYTYLDDLLKYSNEEADDLEVSTPYNRIYKSDMIQKLRYFVRNTDNYSKLGEQIKTEVGSDLYRYFTKDEIGFKDGGTTMQKFPIRRYTADEVKKKSEKVSSMINNVLKEIRWHDGKRVKYPLGEEVAILQSALPDLRAERERVYAVYVDMKRKKQNSISSTQVLTSIPNVRDINLATRLLNAKYVINYTSLNNAMTVDGKFYSGYELNSLENQIGEYSNLLFPESSQNSDREALEYLKSELESEPDNQEIKDAIEYLESEMGEKYADGGEVKYLEIIKGEKSILKARVQKGDASLTGSMIDSLVDKGYKIKEVSKEDYDKFDYSNVDTEDLNDFVSSMDMFN